jgi:hypothetical protein
MARASFFLEVMNFIDFVEPLCCPGSGGAVLRARIAVDAAKSNRQLLERMLRRYVELARVALRDENVTLDQSLVDAFIPAPSPQLLPGKVTPECARSALRMLRRIDGYVDQLLPA